MDLVHLSNENSIEYFLILYYYATYIIQPENYLKDLQKPTKRIPVLQIINTVNKFLYVFSNIHYIYHIIFKSFILALNVKNNIDSNLFKLFLSFKYFSKSHYKLDNKLHLYNTLKVITIMLNFTPKVKTRVCIDKLE